MVRNAILALAMGIAPASSAAPSARAGVDIGINLGYGGLYGYGDACRQAGEPGAYRIRLYR